MNTGGDVAEQMVKMSLEGFEVVVKISGSGARNLAILLAAALKSEQKTAGKSRLTSMLKSGKELTVFSLPQRDLRKFNQEAKKYGVLYCVIKEKHNKDGDSIVDIITRAEDAPKINRVIERFKLAAVDKVQTVQEATSSVPNMGKADKSNQSEPSLQEQKAGSDMTEKEKTSVRFKLKEYRQKLEKGESPAILKQEKTTAMKER